jgi:hemophore-related protein
VSVIVGRATTPAYLFTHPDVNDFFTGLKGQPKDQIRTQVQAFMEANPQVKADLQGTRQPSVDFRARCGVGQ